MKISIITPSFNQGRFIEETIKSVLDQKYPNLEYIVVDGGSTDDTLEILKRYSDKIKWISEKDRGQSDAINKGMRMATGDIRAFLNSDDLYLPNTLKNIAKYFKDNPKARWITGDYYIIDAKGKKIRNYVVLYKRLLRMLSSYTLLKVANYIVQPSTFWRREVVKKFGLFNEKLHYVMDYDYWLRIGKEYPPYIINKPLSAFRIHNLSKSGYQYEKQFKEENELLKKHKISLLTRLIHQIHSRLTIFVYDLIT